MKNLKRVYKILLVIVIVIMVALITRLIIKQYRKSSAVNQNEVSQFVTYKLNGEDQSVLIEGRKKDSPILVLVHGGPGFPIPFNEGCRGMFTELTDSYLTVYWDQLGCGKNRKTYENGTHVPEGITTEDYVLMLKDLLDNLRKDYPGQKVYLFGMSWGSFLTAKIASQYPELIDKVLVYGQFRRQMFQTQDIFENLLNYCNDEEDRQFIENCKVKGTLTNDEIFRIEALIKKYTDGFIYQGKTGKKQSNQLIYQTIFRYLFSPDYSMRDVLGTLTDCADSESVAIQMIHSDITDSIKNIKVPYKILQGEKDLQTSRFQIDDFVASNTNSNITYQIVPDCGHIPTTECFSVIMDEIEKIKE